MINPPILDQTTNTVRYLQLSEVVGQYSMGIFVFPPHSRIPLHDHPGMCVLSRVLYGDLQRLSLDLMRDEDASVDVLNDDVEMPDAEPPKQRGSWLRSLYHHRTFSKKMTMTKSRPHNYPPGTKRAWKRRVDHLQAPSCTVLYPFEGNLHEFVAGPNGAAVLDVLLPPYDVEHHRDCTFYEIQDRPQEDDPRLPGDAVWIVPTGQPEDFHCISGKYRDLGQQS